MGRGVSKRAVVSVYDFIVDYTIEHQYPPSISEICQGTLYQSTQTIADALHCLEEEGKIETDLSFRSPRAYRVTELEIRRKDNAKD